MIDLHLDIDIKTLTNEEAIKKIDGINKVAKHFCDIKLYDESDFCIENSLAMAEAIGFLKGIADSKNVKGLTYYGRKDYVKAIPELIEAAKLYASLSDLNNEAKVYKQLGISYWRVGDFKSQIDVFFKALYIFRELKDEVFEGDILNCIANYYMVVSEYSLSLEYYRMSIELAKKYHDVTTAIIVLYNMACVYSNLQEYDKSLKYFETAFEINSKIEHNSFFETRILNNMAMVYSSKGNYEKAAKIFLKCRGYFIKTKNEIDECDTLVNMGINYCRMKEFDEAGKVFNEVYEICDKINDKTMMSNICREYSNYFCLIKNFEEALSYQKKYFALNHERLNTVEENNIRNLHILHQLDIKKKETEVLTEKNEILRAKNSELIELNKDKNNYMGVAANDLKIPLEKISYSLDELKTPSSESKVSLLNKITEHSTSMQKIIQDLLTANEKQSAAHNG